MLRALLICSLALGLCCSAGACRHSEAPQISAEELDDLTIDMIGRLKDPDARARVVAAQFLAGRGEKAKDALPQLRELTRDKNPQVSAAARVAVERLEGTGKAEK